MAISIQNDVDSTKQDTYSLIGYRDGEFTLSFDEDSSQTIKVEFPFKIDVIPSGYTVSIFAFNNIYFNQSDIFELRVDEKDSNYGRIGYIFSIKALVDHNNNIFNKHILPFAYFAYEALLEAESYLKPKVGVNVNSIDPVTLIQFYSEDLILVVLCDQLTNEIKNFSFDDYLYTLFVHGYTFISNQSTVNDRKKINLIENNFNLTKQNYKDGKYSWKINAPIKLLRDEIYPTVLAKNLISDSHYFLTKFHILYQVIEILINEVLKNEITKNIKSEMSGYKIKKKISIISTEKHRISKLLNNYSKISHSTTELLKINLKTFFEELKLYIVNEDEDEDEKNISSDNISTLIYKFRNNLVHNYRVIHKDPTKKEKCIKQLNDINDIFEIQIFELLHTFQLPTD